MSRCMVAADGARAAPRVIGWMLGVASAGSPKVRWVRWVRWVSTYLNAFSVALDDTCRRPCGGSWRRGRWRLVSEGGEELGRRRPKLMTGKFNEDEDKGLCTCTYVCT